VFPLLTPWTRVLEKPTTFSAIQNISPHFMEPEGSLLHSQGPAALAILSQLDPEHTPISNFLKIKLLIECPVTHISRIFTNTTMLLMFYQITLFA
jgi:hypothetical protein